MILNARRALEIAFAIYAVLILGSMATMSIGAGVLAIALVGAAIVRVPALSSIRSMSWRGYAGVASALAIACTISLVAAKLWPLQYGTFEFHVGVLSELPKLWYLFWPLALVAGLVRITESARERTLKIWLLAAGAVSIVGIQQYFTGWPRPQDIPGSAGRFHATIFFGHHLSTASILIFPFFAALDLAFGRLRAQVLDRRLAAAVVALTGLALFLSYSRMVWIALPVGVMLWACLTLPGRYAAAGVGLVLAAIAALSFHPEVDRRVRTGIGMNERYELWEANLDFCKHRPLTGAGFRNTAELSGHYLLTKHPGAASVFSGHAHNNLLDMLGGTGLLGTLAWLAWSGFVLALAWRAGSPGLACAWVVFQLNGLTQVNFWEGKVEHQMAWVIALTLAGVCRGKSVTQKERLL